MNPPQLTFLPKPDQQHKDWPSSSFSYFDFIITIITGIVLALSDLLE
jgi:quinol-cytochrome oxidoreductase complex cytochrome b subunit